MNATLKEPYFTPKNCETPFAEYVKNTKDYIQQIRVDLQNNADLIIDANCPYELPPNSEACRNQSGNRSKKGVLLIHGLLDSPFSLRDIGLRLQSQGVLSRAVLLPGHGTRPEGLLTIRYQDWLDIVRYGVSTFKSQVDELFLMGYSTGAALSIYQALQNEEGNAANIKGLVLMSPAIKIKAPVDIVVAWHKVSNWLARHRTPWFYQEEEIDYAKYRSVTFNAVTQVAELTKAIRDQGKKMKLDVPMLMVLSREDDTISSHAAIEYFSELDHPNSELLLYSRDDHGYTDSRITTRPTHYPNLNISQFSHVSIPFSPHNHHYGQHGDYMFASHLDGTIYGPYNRIESHASDVLYDLGILQRKRHELTYNPDFEYMAKRIINFVCAK